MEYDINKVTEQFAMLGDAAKSLEEVFGKIKHHEHWTTKSNEELAESLLVFLLKKKNPTEFPKQWDSICEWMFGMEHGFTEGEK